MEWIWNRSFLVLAYVREPIACHSFLRLAMYTVLVMYTRPMANPPGMDRRVSASAIRGGDITYLRLLI